MKQKQLKPRKKCIEMENKNELCQLFTLTLKKEHKHSVRAALLILVCRRKSVRWGLDLRAGTHTAVSNTKQAG